MSAIGILHPGEISISISASALKRCYAAYAKGMTALLGGILATAESSGVRAALAQQWDREGNDFTAGLFWDLDGELRPMGVGWDLGADEFFEVRASSSCGAV